MSVFANGFFAFQSKYSKIINLIMAAFLALVMIASMNQAAMARPAFSAITVDAATGKIIYGKHIDARRYPASLTKVMTLYIMFQEIDAGRMSFNTKMRVSKKASLQQPSKLGLHPGRTISARDAMYALITKSANDAAMVVAEHISGSQAAFAKRMTRTARAMGMTKTTFKNPNGLPDRRQVTTARDMATLGLRIQRDFPRYYKYFGTKSFKYGKRRYGNHNRLLGRVSGVDGIKTGYTRASGFNLLSSRKLNGRRIVGVVMGGRTGRSRNAFMTKILRRDLKKAIRSKNRIAAVAGRPAGYKPSSAKKVVFADKPSIAKAPVPRIKPQIKVAPEQQQIAAIAKSISSGPVPVAQKAQQPAAPAPAAIEQDIAALPANGVTFKKVVVPASDTKSDSLAGQEASTITTASVQEGQKKVQARLATASVTGQPADEPQQPAQAELEGTKVISDAAKIEARLAQHQSTWNIQIGAFPTQEGAKSRIDAAKAKKVRSLNDATPFLMAIDKNGSTIYRARFSGLNKRQARRACRQLKRAGVGCFPLAPSS